MTDIDIAGKLGNPDLITLTPGNYKAVTAPTVFPARVPVFVPGAKLRCGVGGSIEFPELVGKLDGLAVEGTKTTTAPILRIGTGAGGQGSKAHMNDVTVSEPGPAKPAWRGTPWFSPTMEVLNLQNSVHTNVRAQNLRKAANGISITDGTKVQTWVGLWASDAKEWSVLIDTLAGKQRTSENTIIGGMAELTYAAFQIGDAETVKIINYAMNTVIGINLSKSAGALDKNGNPVGPRGVTRLYVEGIEGASPEFIRSDYPVTVFDKGGHCEAFKAQAKAGWNNVTLVPA